MCRQGLAAGLALILIGVLLVGASIAKAPAPPTPTPDVCSENPYYAEALVALQWLDAHPSAPAYASAYSHAVLDGQYTQLLAEGKVDPVPPGCTLTVRAGTGLWASPAATGTPLGTLPAGAVATVYGRSADGGWWNVLAEGLGWGWISAEAAALQPGALVTAIPVR